MSCLKCVTPVGWRGEAPFSQIILEWQQKLPDVGLKDKLAPAPPWPLTLDPMCNRSRPQLSLGEQKKKLSDVAHHITWGGGVIKWSHMNTPDVTERTAKTFGQHVHH